MLALIQEQLQAVYRVEAPDVRDFLLDRQAVAEVLGEEARPADEWVLVRQEGEDLDLGVFVAEEHLEALAAAGSPASAAQGCFRALCAAVEGVSHFLLLVERARRQEPVTLLELEAQAEVDKYLCAALHHPARDREWRARLFEEAELSPGLSATESRRYTEAARLARAWCGHLGRMPHVQAVLDHQRGFWRQAGTQRLDRMRRLAA